MDSFYGIMLFALAGFVSAAFYTPLKYVKWKWEVMWIFWSLAALIICPTLIASFAIPSCWQAIGEVEFDTIIWTFVYGALWGVGGLTFGLSMRYLGIGLGTAVALGFCALVGTLIPPIKSGKILEIASDRAGLLVLIGVFICALGIAINGVAGMMKERDAKAAGADGGFDAVSAGKDGRVGTDPAKGWTDITAQCATKVAADGKTFTVRTGDLIAALGGADAFTAGARVVAVYNAPLNSACNHGIAKGNPNEVYLRYPRSPFADQSGDAGFTRTPSDDATAYTWDLALTKRGSDGDKPLPGAVLSITDDRGRTLAADGTWDAEGKATVTTGEDGRVTVSGVDSGKLKVRELKAPKGYTAFEGTRSVTVKAEGLDVDQVAAAKPKLTITAESPLRADSADGSTGSLEASLINTPTGTPPSITTGGFMPSTGDMAMYAAAAAAVAGAALIVVALLVKRGGGSHKE